MICQRCKQHEATVSIQYPDGSSSSEHYCDQCASTVMHTPLAAHRFGTLFSGDSVLRITFADGDIFRLRDFSTVHPTIYGDADRWTASVVEPVHGASPRFEQLYRPGSGLDFNESDIAEIYDEASSKLVFSSKHVA